MKRPFLIVALLVGVALGLSVAVGVAWHFMRKQATRTAANDARTAATKVEHQARRAAAEAAAIAEASAQPPGANRGVAFAPRQGAADTKAPAPSSAELDGTWRVVSIRNRRGEATNKVPVGMSFRFEGGKLAISHSNAAAKPGSSFHIEPFAKPKEIDITETRSDGQEETVLGIYRLDKSQLFITLDRKNTTRRPNGFVTGVNSGIEVLTLERVP